jgi:Holliday junction resolvase
LINFLSKYLDNKGWNIVKFNEMNADRGHDLEATNGKDNLILECKGFPSEYYVNGSRMRYGLALKWLE